LQAVFARVLYLNRVANNLTNALNIDVITTMIHKTEKTLVDSGATKNFINPKVIERLQFPIRKLEQPRIIYNIDSTPNKAGSITHKCPIKLQFKDKMKTVDFFVTDLGQDCIVLGFPFLKEFNPEINWETGVILPTNKIFATPKYL
jgi:hypothetical protein